MGIKQYMYYLKNKFSKNNTIEEDEIILVYDKELVISGERSNFNMIPIFKYLELFDLYIEDLVFTCSYGLFERAKKVYSSINNELVKRFKYRQYYEIREEPPNILLAILSQKDENYGKDKSINNIINLYRGFNSRLLILIVDNLNFKIFDEKKPLKESISKPPIMFDEIYKAAIKAFNHIGINFNLLDSGKNIGLQQIAFFLEKIEEKNYRKVKKLFLNISKQPYSPMWNYLSYDIKELLKIKNSKNRNITINNVFKLLNIHYKLTKKEKREFIKLFGNACENSLHNKNIRIKYINRLKRDEELKKQLIMNYKRILKKCENKINDNISKLIIKNLQNYVKIFQE